MKKKYYVALFLLSISLVAWAQNEWIQTGTPVQSYQDVETKNNNPIKNDDTNNENIEIAKLQAELTQINRNMLLSQQQLNQHILELTTKNAQLQEGLTRLGQAMVQMEQQLLLLRQQMLAKPKWQQWLMNQFQQWKLEITIASAVLFLMLLAFILWPKSKKKSTKNFPEGEDDTRDEYDYLGSSESIPAKLNLARAYIAMEDYIAATKTLAEVLQQGNSEQQQEAIQLQSQIPAMAK